MRNKYVAATLALLLGVFGVHRYYLGQRFLGFIHLFLFFSCLMLTIRSGNPFILIPGLVGFIDAILLFVMPELEFDERYNRRFIRADAGGYADSQAHTSRGEKRFEPRHAYYPPSGESLKREAIALFRQGDYAGALSVFERALETAPDNPALHFNLACCRSMLRDADAALYHLDKAFQYGFTDLERVHRHKALSYLRALPAFRDFVENGYQLDQTQRLPAARDTGGDDFLDQIIRLGELREKGILTEEEFKRHKKKLLKEE
jgi:tetratricopeptide (TPR) repeat protein